MQVGDTVTAVDPTTGKRSAQAVVATSIHTDNNLVDITLRVSAPSTTTAGSKPTSSLGQCLSTAATHLALAAAVATSIAVAAPAIASSHTEVIHTTTNHPWLTADHGWLPGGFLHLGEPIVTADGASATVEAVRVVPGAARMWDLTVANVHTFAVGDAQAVVHNCGDSAKPGRNLEANGEARPDGVDAQAHHIVPGGSKRAPFARGILGKHGIDIDSAENGMWMSQKGHAAMFRGDYYDWAHNGIENADRIGGKQGVLDFLSETEQQLSGVDQWVRTMAY